MNIASSSQGGGDSHPFPFQRRDSSSSDEDGLREVRAEELEDMEMGNFGQHEEAVALDIDNAPIAPNEANPRLNGNWESEQSALAKLIGMCVLEIRIFGSLMELAPKLKLCSRLGAPSHSKITPTIKFIANSLGFITAFFQ